MKFRLRELRDAYGITQEELASKLGYTQRDISHWEVGRNEADYKALVAIADFFNVTLDELFGRNVDDNTKLQEISNVYTQIMRLDDERLNVIKILLSTFEKNK